MLRVSAGKVVGAAEILLRTHVEIVVVDVVEHGIDAGNSRDADRPWRQSWVAIGVVGAADAEQVVVDALQLETLPGELDGRIGLKRHSLGIFGIAKHQTVVVHARNHRFLTVVGSLLVHDTCQGDDLLRGEVHVLRFLCALKVPELVRLLLHATEQFVERHVPVDVVGVGDKHTGDGGRVVAILLAGGLVGKGMADGSAVEHQLASQLSCEFVECPDRWNGQVDGFLESVLQVSPCLERTVTGMDGIATRANMLGVFGVMGKGAESLHRDGAGYRRELMINGVYIVVFVNIDIFCLLAFRE